MSQTATSQKKTATNRNGTERQIAGLGFLPNEARHGFLIEVPKGTGKNEYIRISEHRNVDLSQMENVGEASNVLVDGTSPQAGSLSITHILVTLLPSPLFGGERSDTLGIPR